MKKKYVRDDLCDDYGTTDDLWMIHADFMYKTNT